MWINKGYHPLLCPEFSLVNDCNLPSKKDAAETINCLPSQSTAAFVEKHRSKGQPCDPVA